MYIVKKKIVAVITVLVSLCLLALQLIIDKILRDTTGIGIIYRPYQLDTKYWWIIVLVTVALAITLLLINKFKKRISLEYAKKHFVNIFGIQTTEAPNVTNKNFTAHIEDANGSVNLLCIEYSNINEAIEHHTKNVYDMENKAVPPNTTSYKNIVVDKDSCYIRLYQTGNLVIQAKASGELYKQKLIQYFKFK